MQRHLCPRLRRARAKPCAPSTLFVARARNRTPPPLQVRPLSTYRTSAASRPSLPFLTAPAPSSTRSFTAPKPRRRVRPLEVLKYVVVFYAAGGCLFGIYFLVSEELRERRYPTPREWSWGSRLFLRNIREATVGSAALPGSLDWVLVAEKCRTLLGRLTDAKYDGQGVAEIEGGAALVAGARDVSGKSENWRRGYYETMMWLARAIEHIDGAMLDKTTLTVFPREYIIGPSYPHPKPLPPGFDAAPREENCEPAYEPAENYYLRILATRGLTARQKTDAALACASYYEFKGDPEGAERMHMWALSLASGDGASSSPSPSPRPLPFDPTTFVLADGPALPSANVLDALTALAGFRAATGHVGEALAIYVSLLRARRALPPPPPPALYTPEDPTMSTGEWLRSLFTESPYPPPPPDGTSPPFRDAASLCEEAALALYIGEILFASGKREEGLGWTREGVDVSEEQLRELDEGVGVLGVSGSGGGRRRAVRDSARRTCRECLATGLSNWSRMAALLAGQEREMGRSAPLPLMPFWKTSADQSGRWAAEEKVVEERQRRTRDLVRIAEEGPALTPFSLTTA